MPNSTPQFNELEQDYLTPNYIEVDEEKEEKLKMIDEAIDQLRGCISNLLALDEDSVGLELIEYVKTINELKELY